MKKFVPFLSIILVFAFGVLPVGAQKGEGKQVVKEISFKEITDENKLFERAKAGISDIDKEAIRGEGVLTNLQTNERKKTPVLTTTQLLKIEKFSDGTERNTYKTSQIGILASYSQKESGTDPTVSYRFTTTIYWQDYYPNNDPSRRYTDFYKATGSETRLDSQVRVESRKVTLTNKGWSYRLKWVNQTNTYYPGSSWSYSNPFPNGWDPVIQGAIGSKLEVILKRTTSGSSWSYTLNNYHETSP